MPHVRVPVGLLLVLLVPLFTECASQSGTNFAKPNAVPTVSPTTAAPAVTATSVASKTASPPTSTVTALDARSLLAEAIQQLNSADSYQFTITATLRTTMTVQVKEKAQPRDWTFSGNGAATKTGAIQWSIEGTADAFFKVVSAGGQSYCADTRGEQKPCNLAFGGPKPGASPYMVIAYLLNSEATGDVASRTLQGRDYHYVTFAPVLSKVGDLDPAFARALAGVASVAGEVWIDKVDQRPRQLHVTLKYAPQSGSEDMVEETMMFDQYNQRVEIRLPGSNEAHEGRMAN